jgi:glycosyltransferase involved in cell wall biosynthesis
VLVLIGPEKNDYSEKILAASTSLSGSVLVLDGLSRIEVEAAIQACDVAILGSKSEMQPIFLLEAMSEGKPWICTRVGSVDELEGGLITGTSSIDIARAICQMKDPSLRKKLGTIGKSQWHSEFQPQGVYDKWNEVLSKSP